MAQHESTDTMSALSDKWNENMYKFGLANFT